MSWQIKSVDYISTIIEQSHVSFPLLTCFFFIVPRCWITDNDTHYIVNIGYYVVVFIFTFTTFIITMSWLFCLKRTDAGNSQDNASGKSIVTIMGLCCLLGITWGFAFFAYGPLRIPSYYIFTVLNSFQGIQNVDPACIALLSLFYTFYCLTYTIYERKGKLKREGERERLY